MSGAPKKDPQKSGEPSTRQLEELRSKVVELEAARKEWHETAAALRTSEEAFRTIFDRSYDGILVVDADRDEIIQVNSKACEMLGYAREELLSLPMSAIHPDEMPKVKALATQVRKEGVGWTNELTCLTKSQGKLASEISASVFDVHGRTCMIALVRDVSERKRAEEELRQANKRMRAELEAAAEIQKSLLPSHAQVLEKVRVAWEVQSCEELDGDTLNVFPLDREHLGLYLLDVSGHGASAAMLSVALHRVLTPVPGPTSLLTRPQDGGSKYDIVSPAVVCRELNSLFPMDADAVIPQYFTLIYGVLSTKTRQFSYALAGHIPPLYKPPRGPAREIGEYGFPIGLFSNASYEDQLMKAEAGARLYFYSDGLTDVVNLHDEAFGRDRVRQAVDESRDRPLEDALSYLLERVQAWSGHSKREDDVSLLAVEIQ